MDIKNKIAVITGVSKGIGKATALALLEKGAKVAGWSRTPSGINHPNFTDVICDVRDFESVKKAYETTCKKWGNQIAILINNAGLGYQANFEDLSVSQWDKMFETNVNGIFYTTKLILPEMKKMQESHVINISSIAGLTGIESMSAYCATKHAVRGLSQSLYKEVRNYGVKVTCIYPGSVKTNFFDEIDSVTINDNMMKPEDIASTILHCLESNANYHHVDIEVRPLMPFGRKA